jgi:hypothetical protein
MEPSKKTKRLQLIPNDRLSSEQKSFRSIQESIPLFKLLREPTHLGDLNLKSENQISIWRENATILSLGVLAPPHHEERYLGFKLKVSAEVELYCAIYGKSDDAIAETAAWFCSLPHDDEKAKLIIQGEQRFDFRALQPQQLAQILDSNPTRKLELSTGTWTAEQAVVLATRPYPLNLSVYTLDTAHAFNFEDNGTAFVEARQNQTSTFGSLSIAGRLCSPENLQRLLNTENFKDFVYAFDLQGVYALIPISAKANFLCFYVVAQNVEAQDIASFNIYVQTLHLALDFGRAENWVDVFVSFMNRLAELGNLRHFVLSATWNGRSAEDVRLDDLTRATDAIIHMINCNPRLTSLNLSNITWLTKCALPLKKIFGAVKEHVGLRVLALTNSNEGGCINAWLAYLLSHNRKIVVLDELGKRITSGSTIDKLYALNQFFCGSATMITESIELRSSLMVTALTESASRNFRYSSLLLSNHTDTLYEFIHDLDLTDATDLVVDAAASPASVSAIPEQAATSKRSRDHSPPVTKKARK